VKPATNLHVKSRLRMRGAIPQLSYALLWCGAYSSIGTTSCLPTTLSPVYISLFLQGAPCRRQTEGPK
jgi:hypothetical protein